MRGQQRGRTSREGDDRPDVASHPALAIGGGVRLKASVAARLVLVVVVARIADPEAAGLIAVLAAAVEVRVGGQGGARRGAAVVVSRAASGYRARGPTRAPDEGPVRAADVAPVLRTSGHADGLHPRVGTAQRVQHGLAQQLRHQEDIREGRLRVFRL